MLIHGPSYETCLHIFKSCSENEIPEDIGDVVLAQNRDMNCQCVSGWKAADCLTDIDECSPGRKQKVKHTMLLTVFLYKSGRFIRCALCSH